MSAQDEPKGVGWMAALRSRGFLALLAALAATTMLAIVLLATLPVMGMRLPTVLPARALTLQVPILQYHAVGLEPLPGSSGAELTVPLETFKAQMDYLAAVGYHTVSFRQIYLSMAGLGSLPTQPVVITFDDGYADQFTVASPILREHGFTATFFVITDAVGKTGYMAWSDLAAMTRWGMSIESHGVQHQDMTALSAAELQHDLVDSRKAIRQHLGVDAQVLAYPGGKYDQRVIEAARASGYLMAVTSASGETLTPGAVLAWPRVAPGASFAGGEGFPSQSQSVGRGSASAGAP